MLLTRKIGAVLRGKATPLQVMLATVLGGVLGFVPGFFLPGDLGGGFLQAPGLILLLLCLVLVLNANLALFGLVTLVGKLLSFAVLPLSYQLGRFLLDGPLQGLYRAAVNGKGTAWFGLEYYATAGGIVFGLLFGVVSGLLLNRTLRALRTHMAGLEEGSERFQKYSSKKSVRLLAWVFLGKGKGKLTWKDLAEQKKMGMPVRISGIAAAAVLVASVWVFQSWFSTPILTRVVQSNLQAVNGATVDLRAARVGLGDGQLLLEGLAIADRNALGKDLIAADTLTATVDTGELLRKRLVIDQVKATNARGNAPRQTPGVIVPGEPAPPEPPAPPGVPKTAEDYLKDFEVWKERLRQARDWLEKVSGGDEPPPSAGEPTPEQQEAERQRREAERIEQERAGLARVVATHLFDAQPRFVIRNIDIEGIGYTIDGKAETLDLRARNLSDAPSLLENALTFDVKAQSGAFAFGLDGQSRTKRDLGLSFAMKDVPVDRVFGQLKIAGAAPLRGGTMDLSTRGSLLKSPGTALAIDLPLNVQMKNTTFALAGAKETKVESLLLPIGLRGPMTKPSVSLDDQALQKALLDAGQKELANFVQGQAGKLLGGTGLEGLVDPSKSLEQNAADALKKAEEEAKKKAEAELKKKAEEELKKRLPGGIKLPGGILPGGGDKKE
jgi:prepilin signal peptidase PulO-like enzyme (type II secretory pathway)